MAAMAVKVTYKYKVSHGNLTSFKANKLLPLLVRRDTGSSVTDLRDMGSGLMHRACSLFQEEEPFHGLHVLLTSQCVINLFGDTSSLKCTV